MKYNKHYCGNSMILYIWYKLSDILRYNLVSNVVSDTYCRKHLLTRSASTYDCVFFNIKDS